MEFFIVRSAKSLQPRAHTSAYERILLRDDNAPTAGSLETRVKNDKHLRQSRSLDPVPQRPPPAAAFRAERPGKGVESIGTDDNTSRPYISVIKLSRDEHCNYQTRIRFFERGRLVAVGARGRPRGLIRKARASLGRRAGQLTAVSRAARALAARTDTTRRKAAVAGRRAAQAAILHLVCDYSGRDGDVTARENYNYYGNPASGRFICWKATRCSAAAALPPPSPRTPPALFQRSR